MASTAPAITVVTPASGAKLTSPFKLEASTTTCGSVPAVSMGYSIDSGLAVIEPTSFTASVTATSGSHTLHVKCWGKGTAEQVLLPITVAQSSPATDISVSSPASGAKVYSPFAVAASSKTCGAVPTVSMGYSIDSGLAVIEPTSFTASVTATSGSRTLHVKCWGKGTAEQVLLPITVETPVAATPQFSLPSGQYTGSHTVTLSDATPGATIYFTTDGSGPSISSPRYTGPISVASSMVIEALAASSGYSNSGLARASYVIVTLPSGPSIPADALKDTEIQLMPNWRIKFDPATNGSASGAMSIVSDPSLSGQAAQYYTTFSYYGGVLYSVTYDHDSASMNFVYDAEVWIAAGSLIGNLEMDNNQVISNGDTVIYAFQCAGDSNTWDYSENAGTPASPVVKWVKSNQSCNPANWTKNAWHHVEISTSRDDAGNVTYHSVWLDGVEYPINQTVMSALSLNWGAADLVANFQVDGTSGSGSSALYLDDFTIYRW
ncbi:MAG: chitobiase/beta-hexosaminidase C-terminal domain-containing protein [Terracidiphilus sp.]